MPLLTMFVPKPDCEALCGIDRGSAIVGEPQPGSERVIVYYEGNRYGAENMQRYDDRIHCAAGRLLVRAGTIAKSALEVERLTVVGTVDTDRWELDVAEPKLLADWAGEAVSSGPTASESRRRERERARQMVRGSR